MSTPNRAARIAKTHKVLKKHYKPATAADRPLLEHLLYACCLQSAAPEAADDGFARLQQAYYDWNEVRVTTISELSEVLACLPRAIEAAARLKRTLQSVFEAYYSFDLESLKKENIGKTAKQLEKLQGVSDFGLAFVTQNALGGHAIPISQEAREVLRVLGVVSDAEAEQGKVPGLERAIPKSKGAEFFSLLHQLGIDYAAAPHSPRVRAVLLEIAPDAKDRLPKRSARKAADGAEPVEAAPTPPPDAADTGAAATKEKTPGLEKVKPPPKPKAREKDRVRDKEKTDPVTRPRAARKAAGPKSAGTEQAKKTPSKRLAKHKPR